MTVTLPPEWAAYVEALASEGRYGSADDIVAHALGLLRARDEAARPLREQLARDMEDGEDLTEEEVEAYFKRPFQRTSQTGNAA